MLTIGKDIEYALFSLVEVARAKKLVSVREISEKFGISYKLLGRLLVRMNSAGLLRSVQGPKGGYLLAVNPETLTLRRIISVIRGTRLLVPCTSAAGDCDRRGTCAIRPVLSLLQAKWDRYLDEVVLADFLQRQKAGEAAHD